MIKLLIVDDEQVERDGMQAILEKHFPNVVIDQAKNGQMAIRLAQEKQPDLVLMDIKMPGMNGLEAVERIKGMYPTIQFIMVTAFDTVEYLRNAIKLGVKDYVMKPSKASEIIVTVGEVLKKIEEERQNSDKNERQLEKARAIAETDIVTQLLFDHVHDVHVDMLVEMLDIPKSSEFFVMLVILPTGSEEVYSLIKERVRSTKSGWVGALSGNQLPIIMFRDRAESYRSQAINYAQKILGLEKNHSGSGWFVGIGSVCSSLDEIRQSYQDSIVATMYPSNIAKYRFYSDTPTLKEMRDEGLNKEKEKQFSEQIKRGDWEQVRLYIMSTIQWNENEGINLLYAQQRVLEILWFTSRVLNEMGVETTTPLYKYTVADYRQLRSATDQLLEVMKKSYMEHRELVEADMIQKVKQYIIEHSEQDISLETLANQVGLSAIYISKMFKEKLGVNYIDFLTECRLEKAKKLLADPEKSIKEITFEVGYHDPNYFSKVFKKMCLVTPKEYRKSLLSIKG